MKRKHEDERDVRAKFIMNEMVKQQVKEAAAANWGESFINCDFSLFLS